MNAQTQEIVAASAQPIAHFEPQGSANPGSETQAYLQMIERAVMDPSFDLNRLDRLIQLQDAAITKRDQREAAAATELARRAFNAAMIGAQAEMRPVVKNAENTHTNSKYATLDAIGEAIDPIITRHGFGQSFSMGKGAPDGHYRVVCQLMHRDGYEREYELDVPIDATGAKGGANKTATHALGSTTSYGRRYLTMLIFNVKTRIMRDDDGNAAGGVADQPTLSEKQIMEIRDLLASTGKSEKRLLATLKVASLEDVYASKFDAVCALFDRVPG